ncbi:oxalate decarboxylase oxdD [Drepanopeziza brunnea f. sp. 'multigermtubi' MB_m1]|uniref:Oxalate decarboxylase oxdD n=1 Tax=Marssonina brunnea f. sp. multigermtubi (strain MB_m1) TaxID=1072389 RepID=K1XHP3_MARBU|nr:oxalate decarboxylase oxdD [Drepanopeziza brunnea f. sp. 'multigermtubi' MB_m1]EKD11979.1 oxalate decarboxylase oxdD [Drepanopeziza brunnea f. sp. 'multigermtubi' MB_m1]
MDPDCNNSCTKEPSSPQLISSPQTNRHATGGGTNRQINLQNLENLGAQSTDSGTVPNLKWSFSDSKTKIFNGGWTRTQVVAYLLASHDLAAAQQHLKKGPVFSPKTAATT